MKRRSYLIRPFLIVTALIATQNLAAQYRLSEIEVDPPNATSDECQYVEIKGPVGAVPVGTFFLSVNADSGNYGNSAIRINLSGVLVGSNGTITLVNTANGPCAGRTYPAGTTLVNYSSPTWLGGGANNPGSEAYLLITTSAPGNFLGPIGNQDLDTDDNGVIDAGFGVTAILDGFQLSVVGSNDFVYGTEAGVQVIYDGEAPGNSPDLPDAVTRFASNNSPFVPAAFYYGELASTPDQTVEYADPRSSNFPSGGVLTPGAANLPPGATVAQSPFDFDGDGKTDISIYRPSLGQWWISRSSDALTSTTGFGQSTDEPAPADFTGDGKTDIAIFRPSTGEWFVLRSEDSSFFSFPFGTTGDVSVPADFDADGKADAAIFRPSTSTWFVRRSTDGVTTIQAFGTTGDLAVPADYDADDKADVAIYRPSTNEWWLNRSSAGLITYVFGSPTDKPVQGDYTGDGKADAAFWRPSTGEWFILRSEDVSYYSVPFGAAADVPAPGDYDGDGKFDTAIFRPSSGTWFVDRSTAGTVVQQFGLATDQPIPNVFVP